MALSTRILTETMLWLSATSSLNDWLRPESNKGMFGSVSLSMAQAFLIMNLQSAKIESLSSQRFLLKIGLFLTISLSLKYSLRKAS